MLKSLTEMTVSIIKAQLLNKDMSKENVAKALKSIFTILKELRDFEAEGSLTSQELAEKPKVELSKPPTVSRGDTQEQSAPPAKPQDSIKENKIVCLECGREFKQLSHTHLRRHELTPKQYRQKHGFPANQPLTAKSLSEQRRKRAKDAASGETLKKTRKAKK